MRQVWPWTFGRSGRGAGGGVYTPGLFDRADPGFGSYFDGHFAITPLDSTSKPCGVSTPFNTTSASSLNVSGRMHETRARERVCLQLLAIPVGRLHHHLVDVLVVLGTFAQRGPEQTCKRRDQHDR